MKSFKDYLEEQEPLDENLLQDVLNLTSKFMYFWKNLWIINTKHGGERIGERNQLTKDQMKLLFKKALDKVSELGLTLNKEILFFSRSLNQGFVSVVVPEGLKLITFLPKGKSFPKPGTDKMVVEGVEYSFDEVIDLDSASLTESVALPVLERQVINILKRLKQSPVGEFPNDKRGYKVTQDKWKGTPAIRIEWVNDNQSHELRAARDNQKKFHQVAEKELDVTVFSSPHKTDLYLIPK